MILTRKIKSIAGITWKSLLIYRADTWLNILFSGARVLLSFLLWQMIFSSNEMVGGYTFSMMVTYAIFSTQLAQLQHKEDHASQLANEVLSGQFSKYLTHPFPITGHFFGVWLGTWSHQLVLTLITIAIWAAVFWQYCVISVTINLLWLLVLIPLGGIFMMLLNHMVALTSLKFKGISGFMILKGSLIEFFSGALIPLMLLPASVVSILKFTPFYYVIFYPVNFLLGAESQPPWMAVLVLIVWCLIVFIAAQLWIKKAHQFYEGAGI